MILNRPTHLLVFSGHQSGVVIYKLGVKSQIIRSGMAKLASVANISSCLSASDVSLPDLPFRRLSYLEDTPIYCGTY